MADAEETPKTHIATLTKGNSYTFLGVSYKRDVDTPVTEEVMELLKKRAVDVVVMDGEFDEEDGSALTEARAKFRFRKSGDAAPVARQGRRRHRG